MTKRNRMSIVMLLGVIALVFSGCQYLDINKLVKDWVEPAFEFDTPPPPGYKPIFVKTVKPMPANLPAGASVQIKSVDTRSPGTTRLVVHVVDPDGTFYRSASPEQLSKMVCEVVEVVDGQERVVKNVKISELNEERVEPMALAMITDNSGSMGQKRAVTVQDALGEFAKTTNRGDALAAVRYDNKVNVEVPVTKDMEIFRSELRHDGLSGYGGGTAILDRERFI